MRLRILLSVLLALSLSVTGVMVVNAQEGDPEAQHGYDVPSESVPAVPVVPMDPSEPPPPPTATFDPAQPTIPFESMVPPQQPGAAPEYVIPDGSSADPTQPVIPEGETPPPVPTPELTKDPGKYGQEAELRALNKVTTRVELLKGPLNTPMAFGNLEITVKTCWSSGADKRPEHIALMEVVEQVPGEGPKSVFSGWMFASSPGLSALEHAVYDLTVVACHDKKNEADKDKKDGEKDKADKDKKEGKAAKKKDESTTMDAPPAADSQVEKPKKPVTKKTPAKKPADKPKPSTKAPPPIPQTVPVTGVLRLPPGPPPAAPQPAGQ